MDLPYKENMNNSMVVCPKCHHRFHRVGDFQNHVITFLKKTLLRKEYYRDGLPAFQSTCYWIARLDNKLERLS